MVDFVDYIQETVIKAKAKGIGDYPNVISQFQSRFTRKAIRPGLFWNSWAWEGGGVGGGEGGRAHYPQAKGIGDYPSVII